VTGKNDCWWFLFSVQSQVRSQDGKSDWANVSDACTGERKKQRLAKTTTATGIYKRVRRATRNDRKKKEKQKKKRKRRENEENKKRTTSSPMDVSCMLVTRWGQEDEYESKP
jgi:hypothetical protein